MNETSIAAGLERVGQLAGVRRDHELDRQRRARSPARWPRSTVTPRGLPSASLTTNSGDSDGAKRHADAQLSGGDAVRSMTRCRRLSPDPASAPRGSPRRRAAWRAPSRRACAPARRDAVGAGDAQPPQRRPAEQHGAGAERQRLDDVGAAADAAVDIDLGACRRPRRRSRAITSAVVTVVSRWRPPWFDTMMPLTPQSTQRLASSPRSTPLTTTGMAQRFTSHSRSREVGREHHHALAVRIVGGARDRLADHVDAAHVWRRRSPACARRAGSSPAPADRR